MRTCWLLGTVLAATVTSFIAPALAGDKKDNVPPPGYTALFDGKDFKGWQGALSIQQRQKLTGDALEKAQQAANTRTLKHWTIDGGVLTNDGQGGNLASVKNFADFELLVDWKIEPKGDSGIYLRGVPQVQIWDSESLSGGLAADKGKGSGGLWNNAKGSKGKEPLKNADKAAGAWNHFRIIMKGKDVSVYLNGQLVVDQAPFTVNGWPLLPTGPIELQQHPKQDGTYGKIQFKNIYVKEL